MMVECPWQWKLIKSRHCRCIPGCGQVVYWEPMVTVIVYICGCMLVCPIPGGAWSWPYCKGSRILLMWWWRPPRAHRGSAWPRNKKHRVHRPSRTGPVAFSYCSTRPCSPFRAAVGWFQRCSAVGIKVDKPLLQSLGYIPADFSRAW